MLADVQKQSQELATKMWNIANELRGTMDASKFKDYILGTIFYRYLSERTEKYMDDLLRNDNMTYREALQDPEFREAVEDMSLSHLGYIIQPDDLFDSLVTKIKDRSFSIEDYEKAVQNLVGSTVGQDSEAAFEGLFDDMDLKDRDLGKEVSERTKLISSVISEIASLSFSFDDAEFDLLGTAYMHLIGLFASGAGKKGGEFYSPVQFCILTARLATCGLNSVRSACDPCAGSGSMLLEVCRQSKEKKVGHYYGQEKNGSTYNLMRQNLLMHGVPYKEFTVYNGDTLENDYFGENRFFHVQVSNPPYSAKYSASPKFEDDYRYSACGALAPKSHADMMFLEHIVYHMDKDGRAAVLLPHGVLFRGNSEEKIRQYLISSQNVIDAIIGLPANCFHGTSIPVVCVVLRRNRNGNSDNIWFCDASRYYTKGKNMNTIRNEDIDRIVDAYEKRAEIDRFSRKVSLDEIVDEHNYNLNIPRYVDTREPEPEVDLFDIATQLRTNDTDIADTSATLQKSFDELGLKFPF